jgi:ubiquinone/menaquinone biosynthesis C-methylase UbiE
MAKSQKAYKGLAMEGRIARWYARNTKDDARFRGCADALTASLPSGARVLEVAPGPGYLAIELARRGFRVSGLDISESFVRIAREQARAEGLDVDVQLGNASQMPYADASFDFVVCQAAFKNFSDPLGALNEIFRVLAPAGQAAIHDLRKEASREEIAAEIRSMKMSFMSRLWTRIVFRTFLLKNAYTDEGILRLARQSRFAGGELVHHGLGFELRLSRHAAQSRAA